MSLPETNMLNFFNKVLISLADLTPSGESCPIDSLIKQCQSFVLGGVRGEYDTVINHCKSCGLVAVKNNKITLSTLGHKFLSANRERFFEVTEAQKQIIAERIVFKGAWNVYARELFEYFTANQTTATYELSTIETLLPIQQNTVVHFFKYIGILSEQDYVLRVERKYTALVYELTADGKALTEQQLEKILMENRKLGAQAEQSVVDFEKQRLRKLGKVVQAELVKRISPINTAAGYDIVSFDGTSDDIEYDRFIEVKATQSDEIRFYWSNNEMNVAKNLKEKYWIYMMKEFNESQPQLTLPIMIQNPATNIKKSNYLTIEAHTFLIKEVAVVDLVEFTLEEIKWFQLV
jgi:hypothetical protein